jgi:hypothetical protein
MSDWPYFITDVIYDLDHHHRSRQSWRPALIELICIETVSQCAQLDGLSSQIAALPPTHLNGRWFLVILVYQQ